jgi:hypothetical protein
MTKTKCEVYSRVVGYIRPINQWNDGKQAEFEERKNFTQLNKMEDIKCQIKIEKVQEVVQQVQEMEEETDKVEELVQGQEEKLVEKKGTANK